MNILKELFYGNVYPYEKQTSRNSELDNLRQLVLRNERTTQKECQSASKIGQASIRNFIS